MLDRAIEIAERAHRGQNDRYGAPYILHPLRVMQRMDTELQKIVAVLHDVVEDSEWTLDALREVGFSEEVVEAVDRLSKRDKEPYPEYIERVARNGLAVKVKIADLEDNMDVRRIPELTQKDAARLQRYHGAWIRLAQSNTVRSQNEK